MSEERLSEERLREIEARVEGASHGPWRAKDGGSRSPSYIDVPPPAAAESEDADDEGPLVAETFTGGAGDPFANALFIASARQDVPDLVAEIRALRAERDRLAAEAARQKQVAASALELCREREEELRRLETEAAAAEAVVVRGALERLHKAVAATASLNDWCGDIGAALDIARVVLLTDTGLRALEQIEAGRQIVALLRDRERVGRLMHESWSHRKRAQGWHGPRDECQHGGSINQHGCWYRGAYDPMYLARSKCEAFHHDLIPWSALPEEQKDINRHALDAVLAELAGPLAAWDRAVAGEGGAK